MLDHKHFHALPGTNMCSNSSFIINFNGCNKEQQNIMPAGIIFPCDINKLDTEMTSKVQGTAINNSQC
uniref:Uncharacterized protein n=1 Tax=Anguilla anguilla TaxID=7936 RepID=A0A0E9PRV1_ANGAN